MIGRAWEHVTPNGSEAQFLGVERYRRPQKSRKTGKNHLAFLGELPLLVRNPGLGPGRM